jgi:hypothetical protein
MSSFGAMAHFRVGYYQGVRNYLMRERREVAKRIEALDQELDRIGRIRVQYARKKAPNGTVTVSENRVGFTVTKNSSLERLIQAYVVNGGNPFDISHFFFPDEVEILSDGTVQDNYPYGGVVSPQTADYNEPKGSFNSYPGGYIPLKKYVGNRLGRREVISDEEDMVFRLVHKMREWNNQAIDHKLHSLERRILRLCDLREQLRHEKEQVLVEAHGSVLQRVGEFDEDLFLEDHRFLRIVDLFDKILFETGDDGKNSGFTPDRASISQHDTFWLDVNEEWSLSLMS